MVFMCREQWRRLDMIVKGWQEDLVMMEQFSNLACLCEAIHVINDHVVSYHKVTYKKTYESDCRTR